MTVSELIKQRVRYLAEVEGSPPRCPCRRLVLGLAVLATVQLGGIVVLLSH